MKNACAHTSNGIFFSLWLILHISQIHAFLKQKKKKTKIKTMDGIAYMFVFLNTLVVACAMPDGINLQPFRFIYTILVLFSCATHTHAHNPIPVLWILTTEKYSRNLRLIDHIFSFSLQCEKLNLNSSHRIYVSFSSNRQKCALASAVALVYVVVCRQHSPISLPDKKTKNMSSKI